MLDLLYFLPIATGIEAATWAWIAAATATAGGVATALTAKKPKFPTTAAPPKPTLPTLPLAEPEVKKKEKERLRRGATGQTILTSPQGVLTKAPVERKFLLGE